MTQQQRADTTQKTDQQPAFPALAPVARPGPAVGELSPEQKRVLLVAAHPDDPEFSSAGTVANWVREGIDVVFVLVTSGDKGTPDHTMTGERLSNMREQEQVEAASRLGVTQVHFLRFPDGELTPSLELRGAITRMIRMFKPYAVMTHDPLTLFYNNEFINHPDHRAVGQATIDAIYPTARDPLQFAEQTREGLEPHKVKEIYLWGSDQPNVVVDISDTIEVKIEALKAHQSQVGTSADLEDRIRMRAAQVAEPAGLRYGEAFRRIVMRM
ncbi:MAG TPA: PIG-L deacetylase family protein [Chloroflexia bacterium]|nr:PIG-L deacetylase family protein [Chloroflexia bacterium]